MAIITPQQLAKPNTESAHQQALFCHLALERAKGRLMVTQWLHHIPNGRERKIEDAAALKAEGVKAGIWDLALPVAARGFHGWYAEMKAPKQRTQKNGGLSDPQIEYGKHLVRHGYSTAVFYHWEEAVANLEWYLYELEPHKEVISCL